ncbi:hypothetical protein [Glutamicibacter sp.]|uniref:hypothetical protein n=1 Tax=Glutamicibacter sp. TaxID=1931995 RepID=UPI0028BF031F|nr:hypothetical protein [Glutamicibacter sp.]
MITFRAFTLIALSLTLTSVSLNQYSVHPAIERVCSERKTSGHRSVNIAWTLCAQNNRKNPKSFLVSDKKSEKVEKKQEVRIRDFDTCQTGLEKFMGCQSNPDIKPCKDNSFPIVRQIIRTQDSKVLSSLSMCPEDPKIELPKDSEIVEVIKISNEQFRTFPLKPSKVNSDPSNFSLRNGFTHFWAATRTQNFNVNIASAKVAIRAIPVQWIWNYGDGTNRRFDFPGEAVPNHTLHDETSTSHVYEETGKFKVVVTTLYRGEFSVDGGPWERIPGQASVPSDPVVMDVWRTKKELIATD